MIIIKISLCHLDTLIFQQVFKAISIESQSKNSIYFSLFIEIISLSR